MKLSTKVALIVASAPFLAHCAVEVRGPRVYVPPPPPPPTVQVDVPAPPAPAVEAVAPPTDYDDNDPSALTDFHAALDPHGQWVEDSKYGTVWVPNPAEVGADFVPYSTGGHWTYGDDYTWVSDYDWGWAPFHYGRWVMGDQGWSWIPGRTYAPAWVSWSTGDPGYGYVGWAPAPPEFYWRGGSYVAVDWVVEPRWGYARSGDLFEAHLGGRVLRGGAAVSISGRMHPFGGVAGGVGGGGGHGHAAGPAPTAIGVNPGKIVHPSANDPGLAKAKGFSNPTTAASLGGHAPQRNLAGTVAGNRAAGAGAAGTTAGHVSNVKPGETLTRTTSTTTATTARTPATAGASNPAIHEQGAAAATHPTTVAPRPTATAASGPPPSHGGGRKK